MPEWTWISGVLLVDVAHADATVFRVDLLPTELTRRPSLDLLVCALSELLGPVMEIGLDRPLLLAILAKPQVTHYVQDGFIWRRDQLSLSFLGPA